VIAVEALGGLAIILGWQTRIAAIALSLRKHEDKL
jgi:uncharacterized membrane protein YphA (DoxX/SURF4 family)